MAITDISLEFSAYRTITAYTILEFPCERIIENDEYITLKFPCERIVKPPEHITENINVDVVITNNYILNIDLERKVESYYNINVDLVRKIPHDIIFRKENQADSIIVENGITKHIKQKQKHAPISLQITLSEQTLQDKFNLKTTEFININDVLKGKILDFSYNFIADRISWTGLERTIEGMYDVDKLLYSKLKFENKSNVYNNYGSLYSWGNDVASALGKKLNYNADNFNVDSSFNSYEGTYSSLISSLYGWSSAIPNKIINVFIRANDNSINIVQRGNEKNLIDITDIPHSYPNYQQEIMRTVANVGETKEEITSNYIPENWEWLVPPGPNGEYIYPANGDGSAFKIKKENGYPIQETIYHPNGARTEKNYEYGSYDEKYHTWGKEIEVNYDSDGNMSQSITEHKNLGGDWYSHVRYDDGEYVGSSISQGVPIAEVGEPEMISAVLRITLPKSDITRTLVKGLSIPTDDLSIIKKYAEYVVSLDRKIKETVTLDLYKYNHVIDFYDKIIFKGNEYYLVSNNISYDLKEHKQQLTLVRWF